MAINKIVIEAEQQPVSAERPFAASIFLLQDRRIPPLSDLLNYTLEKRLELIEHILCTY